MRDGTAVTTCLLMGYLLWATSCPWWVMAVAFIVGAFINYLTNNRTTDA